MAIVDHICATETDEDFDVWLWVMARWRVRHKVPAVPMTKIYFTSDLDDALLMDECVDYRSIGSWGRLKVRQIDCGGVHLYEGPHYHGPSHLA